MTWRPSQPNGWNPRLTRVGDRILVLYGFGDVWVAELTLALALVGEHRLAAGGAFPMGWISQGRATWSVEVGPNMMARFEASGPDWIPDLMADDRGAVAGNLGVADAGHWATYLAAPMFRTVIDGQVVTTNSGGALAMAWPWVVHAATNDNLMIRRFLDGRELRPDLPTAVPMNSLVVGRLGHIAYGPNGDVHAIDPAGNALGSQTVTPWRWEVPIRIVDVNGTPNLVTRAFDGTDGLFLIRPFGQMSAKVVRIWATNGDVLQVGEHLVVAGSGPKGELTVTRIRTDQPAEVLPATLDPLPRGYVAYWYDEGKFGPATAGIQRRGIFIGRGMFEDGDRRTPANWVERMTTAIASAGAGFVTVDDLDAVAPIWDRIHGVWVHEPDAADANAEAETARVAIQARGLQARPIICVIREDHAASDAFRVADYQAYDWLAPEIYEPRDATVDDWRSAQGRMARRIARVLRNTLPMRVILVGQCYDRRATLDHPPAGFSEEALEAYQPTYFDAWRSNPGRVLGVGLFSYWGRPGGTNPTVRPDIIRWHEAAVAASPGLPAIEVPTRGGTGGGGGTVAPKIAIEGTWPVQVEVDAGAKARVRAVAKVVSGKVARFEWRIRKVGLAWEIVARNPASDLDHHFEVGVGEYQIGLEGIGPDGRDSTGADRRIVVVQKAVDPGPGPGPGPGPDPEPEPTPGDQVVRFLAPDGRHYLTALNGGGHPGEVFRDQPAGLVTAHVPARDAGGWQDFTIRGGKRTGTFGLRSVNGGWVALQADNRLVANVHRPADYQPEGAQAFILADLGGGRLSIQGANGRFLAALQAGGGDVVMDRETAKDWERWDPTVDIAIPDLEPESTRVDRALVGRVRPHGPRGIRDDVGPFLATTLSRFYLMSAWDTDRDRVLRELDMDAKYGYCPRVLAEVGSLSDDYWAGQSWDPNHPRTQEYIAAITNEANQRGIKVQWTAMGKGPFSDNPDKRRAVARRVGEAVRDLDGVLFLEAINEPPVGWSNGPGESELKDLARVLDEASGGGYLVATGSVWTNSGTDFSPARWGPTQAFDVMGARAVGIVHNDRDTSKNEHQDRPWRQPWDVGLENGRTCDNEPIGLGSSVNSESRPAVLRSHRLVAHICRMAMTCLHGSPGVRGRERWEDVAAYHEAWKSRRFLDADMVNGKQLNANANYPDRPFDMGHEYLRQETGNQRGIVRCYSVQAPSGVIYTVPFGPVDYTYPDKGAGAGTTRLVARRRLTIQAFQQDLGVQVWERTVNEGEVVEIDSRYPDLLLVSR